MGLDYAEPALDEIVSGKYRLTRLIGRGGMGSVWEGVHLTLGNRVAVKFIDPTYAESPEARQRFENEARAAARLNSKYAVQVYDHGVMPDGRPFIVMEFLVGEPLDARLEREGRISPADTARIVSQVCRALSRAHSVGIVHRDLKPENVFLVWDEEDQEYVAKVVDFGICKFTDGQVGISSSTRTGSVLGTPYYMSPEQARGLRTVDYRTDLWSLGVIAYRCIVGRLPFEGESVGDLLVKICTFPIPVPSQVVPGLPPGFDGWFARALQREPGERFATAQELSEQLMIACGLGVARQSLQSGQLGYAGEPAVGPVLGHSQTSGGVPGVTAASTKTDVAFAKSTPGVGSKNRVVLLSAGIGLGIVLAVAIGVGLMSRKPAVDARGAMGDLAMSAQQPAASAELVPALGSSLPTVASATVQIVPSAPSIVPEPSNVAASAPSANKAPAPRAAATRANPPPQPARRPANNRGIDVGY